MPKTASSFFPPKDWWLPTLPLLPLVTLTVLVQPLIDPNKTVGFLRIGETQYVSRLSRDYIHLADMLVYYSFTSVHVFICLFAICYFSFAIRKLPERECMKSKMFLLVISMLVIVLVICFAGFANKTVLVQLGYKAICMVIEGAKLPTNLVEGGCFGKKDITKLTLLAWIPTFSGMGAVVVAAAFAYGNAGGLALFHDSKEWRIFLKQRINALQRSVYVLSVVLVSSTITITLFAHLPTGLLEDSNGLAKAVSAYAIGLSTFWGALFSLTLVATFAAPAFRILRQAYGFQADTKETAAPTADLRDWLHEHVFVSLKKQLVNVLSLLAPLLVGPLGSLLSNLPGT